MLLQESKLSVAPGFWEVTRIATDVF